MDGFQLDTIARSLANASRRRVIKTLAGAALMAVLGREAENARAACPAGQLCVCPPGKQRCGGSCYAPCPAGQSRSSSCQCVCPTGTSLCGGACVANCSGGKVRNGNCQCVCPSGKVACGGACVTACAG